MKTTWIVCVTGIVMWLSSSAALGQWLQNGSFDDGLTDWNTNGDVAAVAIPQDGVYYARLEETLDFRKKPMGGRSSIHQVFEIPPDTGEISFRYRLFSGPNPRVSTVPPDSFTAFLLNASGTERLVPVTGESAPAFSQGFFYADSDGEVVYDTSSNSLVSVDSEPAADGMTTVRVDISSLGLESEPIRLEFGLASAANGVTSYAVVDGIDSGEPPYLCVFTDKFNRPDHHTVGNGWWEYEWQGQDPEPQYGSVSILDNALRLGDPNDGLPDDNYEAGAESQWIMVGGVDGLFIRFDWAPTVPSDNDSLIVEWEKCKTHDWLNPSLTIDLSTNGIGTVGEFQTHTFAIPGADSLNCIRIRIRTETSWHDEGALIDRVEVCGNPPEN